MKSLRPDWRFRIGMAVFLLALTWIAFHPSAKRADERSPQEKLVPQVVVVAPVRQAAVHTVTLAASVEAFERATLYAKVSGYLSWIGVDKGDRVHKGQELARIAVPEMQQEYAEAGSAVHEAEAGYERAQANAKLKALTADRLAQVRKEQPDVISQQEVDVALSEAEVAAGDVKLASAKRETARSHRQKLEAMMQYATITAPYDGVITERFVDPGAMIQTAISSTGNVAPLVSIASIDKVRVYIYVPEPDVALVRQGNPAEIHLDALPGRTFRAAVTRFATVLDPQTRTMKTEIDLPNSGHDVRPGMFGSARLELGKEGNALFVPSEAVRKDSDGTTFVFTVAGGRVAKRAVKTGLDDGKLVQVSGIEAADAVVVSRENLQPGQAVRAVTVQQGGSL